MKHIRITILIFTLFTLKSCISPPDNIIAPSFDADIAFPLTDTLFTLNEFIKDDSSIVASNDPNKLGVLVFHKETIIEPFYIDENLKIDSFSTFSSTSIGVIKINDTPPIETNIALSDWTPLAGGTDIVFPEASNPITSNFELIGQFESALFNSAKLEITVHNNLPVETQLRTFKILNSDGSIILDVPANSPITTSPFGSTTDSFILTDVAITNNLSIEGILYTPGSGTDTVTIPMDANTKVIIKLSDLEIETVTGKLPEQPPFILEDSFIIDDSTKIETIRFNDGNFKIIMNNDFDIDLKVEFEVKNLFDENNQAYKNSFNLLRNEKNKIFYIPTLVNWGIKTLTPGTPTNELVYSVSVVAKATNDIRTISKGDSVSVSIEFGEATIKYAVGLIKPTKFNLPESDFSFELGDIEDQFNFDSMYISAPSMILDLSSSVNFDLHLNGIITGTSSNLSKELEIQLDLPARLEQKFDLNNFGFTEFVNSFTTAGEIPNKFTFSGNGVVNPDYVVGSISKTDSISGEFLFEAPLNFGISGGSFQDTIRIDNIDIEDNTIESINSVELTIETLNKIPVNIMLEGTVLDESNKSLFPFPPSYNDESFLIIKAPTVDENGNVVSATIDKQIVKLTGSDAKAFIHNPNIAIKFSLDTPPINSVAPVKFKSSDEIYFKIYGKINYIMNNN